MLPFSSAIIIALFSRVGSRGLSRTSLPPGGWLFGRDRLAVDAASAESEFLVRVVEEGGGVIVPRRSTNCSSEPVMGKLFCTSKRRRTSLVSPEVSIESCISGGRRKKRHCSKMKTLGARYELAKHREG